MTDKPVPINMKPKAAVPPRPPRATGSPSNAGSPSTSGSSSINNSPVVSPPTSPKPQPQQPQNRNLPKNPPDVASRKGVNFSGGEDKEDSPVQAPYRRPTGGQPIQVDRPPPALPGFKPPEGEAESGRGKGAPLNRSLSDKQINKKQAITRTNTQKSVFQNNNMGSPAPSRLSRTPPMATDNNISPLNRLSTAQPLQPLQQPQRPPQPQPQPQQHSTTPTPPPRNARRTNTGGRTTNPPPVAPRMPPARPLPSPRGTGGQRKITNFDEIWNEFQKIATVDSQSEATAGDGGRRVEKWKKFGRLSGKFSSPVQIRRTAHFVCCKLDVLTELLNRNKNQEFIGEIGDVLIHLNGISAGLKEMDLTGEKQVLIDLIRAFVLVSKDRIEGKAQHPVWLEKTKALGQHLKRIQSLIPESDTFGIEQPAPPPAPAEVTLTVEDKEKKERLRLKALEELMFSEKAYLLQLLTLMHTLVEPLKREESQLPGLKGTEFWTMFSFLRPIVDITKKLVKDFAKATRENQPIGAVFLSMAPVLKMYVSYINCYDAAIESLAGLMHSSEFKRIIDAFLATAEHPTVDFYLILPIQRLPRYEMLLKEILKFTAEDNEDWANLQAALAKVKETNDFVNQKKREDQNRRQLADIQSSIISKETLNLVQRGRTLKKEGALFEIENSKRKKHYYYFLFNDLLIKTKPHSYDKKTNMHQYKFVKKINLLTANVVDAPASEDGLTHLFLVIAEEVNYFFCLSREDKQEWMKAIGDTISELKGTTTANDKQRNYIQVGEESKG